MSSTTPTTNAPSRVDRPNSTCPRCLSRVEHRRTESVCPDCGLVVDDAPINHGPDWRSFGSDERDPSHAAPGNQHHHDKGLGSEIAHGSDADTARLRTWHRRAKSDKKGRNHAYATTEITRMASALDLPGHVRDRARHLWGRLHRESLEGHDMDALAPACLFVACREDGQGLSRNDLAAVSHADAGLVTRRALLVADRTAGELPPPSYRQRVRVIGAAVGASAETVTEAVRMVAETDAEQLSGRDPSGVAAAALWAAGDHTQAALGDAGDVCPRTIREARDAVGLGGDS